MRSPTPSRRSAALCAVLAFVLLSALSAASAGAETVVSFTFDDGLSSAPAAGSVLTAKGIKATFYIITGDVGTSGFVTWSNIAKLAAEGHEIGGHTVTHADLPSLTPSEQEEQICGSRRQLEEHGYEPHTFAYPHGDFNLESVRLLQVCGFSSARLFGTYQGGGGPSEGTSIYPEPFSIPNAYELSTQGSPERRVELKDLENDYVWGEGGWVIIALHGVCPSTLNPKESECAGLYGPTSAAVLEQYAKWAQERPKTIVRTVGQVVEDTVLPKTTISCNASACSNPYPSTVNVSLSASDSNLTVTETRYTTNGSEPTTSSTLYTGSFPIASTKTVKFRSWDLRGKAEPIQSQTVTIDTPPVTTIESEPASLSNEAVATFKFSANKSSTFECSLDGGGYSACTSPYHSPTLADGTHSFSVRAIDGEGSTETNPPSYSWIVDMTPPVTTIESKPASPTSSKSASITFSASESATFECELDGAGYKACSSPSTASGLSDGQHTFKVRATDTAGNKGAAVSYSWTVDTTPPVVTIESEPASPTSSKSASITFSASESATFECELDGAGFKACSSPSTASGLSDGQHTFKVRATDTAGNKGAAVSYSWTVDTTPPVVTIESEPASPTSSKSASITFSANESATFECELDGAGYKVCSSPFTASGLGDGLHTFKVRATDTAGNKGSAVSYSWTVDTTPPVVTIENRPASPTNSTSASVSFSANETATFECQLDGAGFKVCSSPFTASGLGEGQHTFEVRATDTAGNKGGAVSYSWTVDTTPPVVTIESKPASPTNSKSASITFSANESATFECELDGAGFKACSSPFTASALAEGLHTFKVRAADTAGNKGSAATYSWTVDSSPPSVTIESKPASLANSTSASISFSANKPGTFECELDGVGYKACSSPFTASGLGDGQHTFRVRATDTAGNKSSEVSYSWTIDTTPPVVTIESKPASPTNSKSASISFSANESATFECELDGAGYKACSSPSTASGLSDGQHTFKVRATDTAGNKGSAVSYSWTIDTTPPVVTIESKPASPTSSASASVSFSANEAAGFECKLDGAAFKACSSPFTASGLSEGQHTFEVRATDTVGNKGSAVSYSWTIDTTPPVATIESKPASPTNSKSASISFSANEPATFECELDGAGYKACSSPFTASGLADGQHTFKVRATDTAGNKGAAVSYSWTVDTTPPVATIESKPASPTNSTGAAVSFLADEEASFECRLDGAAFKTCSSPFTAAGLGEGEHTFEVRATDTAGNKGSAVSYSWTVDLTPPIAAIEGGPASPTNSTNASISFSADETASFECELDGTGYKACSSPFTANGLSDAQHTFKVRATDTAGNKGAAVSYSWTVDTTPPVVTIESKPASLTDSSAASISFAANETATFECKLDSGDYKTCSSPFVVSGLGDGEHAFGVRATDTAGNQSGSVSYSWTVDTTPPVTTVESHPPSLTNSTGASISFSADEAATFECRLKGGAFAPCSSPFPANGLADGEHVFEVRATDLAGNRESVPQSYSWIVDTTTPVTTIETTPPALTNVDTAAITFSAGEPATFECSLDGGAYSACTSPYQTGQLADGGHTFVVRAKDVHGVEELRPPSYSWIVDTTPPVTTIETSPLGQAESTDVSVAFSADEQATFQCSLDGAVYAACTSPYSSHGLSVGFHTLRILATDSAGNVEVAPAAYTWTVLAPPPPAKQSGQAPPSGGKGAEESPITPTAPLGSPRLGVPGRLGVKARQEGVPVRLYCPGSCTAKVVVSLLAPTSKKGRSTRHRVLARASAALPDAQTLRLKVRLAPGSGGSLGGSLRSRARLQVMVTVRLSDGSTRQLVATAAIGAGLLAWLR